MKRDYKQLVTNTLDNYFNCSGELKLYDNWTVNGRHRARYSFSGSPRHFPNGEVYNPIISYFIHIDLPENLIVVYEDDHSIMFETSFLEPAPCATM